MSRARVREIVEAPAGDTLSSLGRQHRLVATSIGSSAAVRIHGRGMIGRVHSVFGGAIDVIVTAGSMFSIVREEVGAGPINIVTNLPVGKKMTEMGVESGQEVLRRGEDLVVGGGRLLISLRGARVYMPEVRFHRVNDTPKIRQNVAIVARTAEKLGNDQGLGGLIERIVLKRRGRLNPYSRFALPRVRSVLRAIRAGKTSDLERETKNLVGLGPGLTPSGDDVLSGLMATLAISALNLKGGVEKVREINERIALAARTRTTSLSQEYLSHAARGETNQHFLELIKNVLTGGPEDAKRATELVLRVGETSGTDTVLGVLLGFQLSLERKSAV